MLARVTNFCANVPGESAPLGPATCAVTTMIAAMARTESSSGKRRARAIMDRGRAAPGLSALVARHEHPGAEPHQQHRDAEERYEERLAAGAWQLAGRARARRGSG